MLDKKPVVKFREGLDISQFVGNYAINLSIYNDLSLTEPTKFFDKKIDLRIRLDCNAVFNSLANINESIDVYHGPEGMTLRNQKLIQTTILAYKL